MYINIDFLMLKITFYSLWVHYFWWDTEIDLNWILHFDLFNKKICIHTRALVMNCT